MSGPKVVVVVTREEAIATCERGIRQLQRAINDWQTRTGQLGVFDDIEHAHNIERLAAIKAMLGDDQFLQVQEACKLELSFLQRSLGEREAQAVAQAATHRANARRRQDNKRLLLGVLASDRSPEAQKLTQRLRADEADAVAESLSWWSRRHGDESGLNQAQQSLADALKDEHVPMLFEKWKATQPPGLARNPRIQRVDTHIAELQLLSDEAHIAPFLARLGSIEQMDEGAQQNLLLDSLVLDLAQVVRRDADFRAEFAEALRFIEEIAAFNQRDAEALRGEAELVASTRDAAQASALRARCQSIIDQAAEREAAQARRKTVLAALADLGYEVQEGMATAWAEQGRLALRKHATPGYGMEIAGAIGNLRMQMRTVAFDAHRDRGRDRDVETLWCGDIERLQERLAEDGGGLIIERALGAGERELKEVAAPVMRQQEGRVLKQRSI